jgi:hypothetical protein
LEYFVFLFFNIGQTQANSGLISAFYENGNCLFLAFTLCADYKKLKLPKILFLAILLLVYYSASDVAVWNIAIQESSAKPLY